MIQASINSKLNTSQKNLSKVDTSQKASIKSTSIKAVDANTSQSAIKVLMEQAYKSKSNSKSVTKSNANHAASSIPTKPTQSQSFNRNLKLEKALIPVAVTVNTNSTKSDKQPESKRPDKLQPDLRKSTDFCANYDKLLQSNKGAESKLNVPTQSERKKSIAGNSNSIDYSQIKSQVPAPIYNKPTIKIGSPKPEITIKTTSPKINFNDITKEFNESGTYFPKHQQELQTIETNHNCSLNEEIEIRSNCGSVPNLSYHSLKPNTNRPSLIIGSGNNNKIKENTVLSKQVAPASSAQQITVQSQPQMPSLFNFAEIDFLIDNILKLQGQTPDLILNPSTSRRKMFNKEHIAELYLFYYSRSKMNIKELLNLISIDPYTYASEDMKKRIASEIKNDSDKRVGKYKECLQYINYALSEVSNMIQDKEIEHEPEDDNYEDLSHMVLCSETISSPKSEDLDQENSLHGKSKKQKRSWYDCCTNNVLGELEIIKEEIDESRFTSKGASRADSNESDIKKRDIELLETSYLLDINKGNSSLKFNNADSLNTDTIVHLPSIEYGFENSKESKLQASINSISSTLDTPHNNCHGINFKSKQTQQASLNLRSLEILCNDSVNA